MSKRTLIYLVCDGCRRDELHNKIRIVKGHVSRYGDSVPDVHICADCYDADMYYCHRCHSVHSDENLCDAIREMLEEQPQAEGGHMPISGA